MKLPAEVLDMLKQQPAPWTFDGDQVWDANGDRVWDVADANDYPPTARAVVMLVNLVATETTA